MGTYAAYLSGGSGAVGYRLVIEGCPYEFVSDLWMEGAIGDGRYRVRGLLSDGLSIDESARMASAELSLRLSSVQIAETTGTYLDAATAAFTLFSAASARGYIAESMAAGDGVALITGGSAIAVNDVLHVGTAAWRVDSIDRSGTTAPDTFHITEGMWRTTAQSFAVTTPTATDSESPILVEVTNAPGSYAGRRVWLYGHGTSETSTSDTGTLLWRGVLAVNPELTDVGTWSLSMQSRLSLFDAEIGKAAQGGTKIRGAYYPDECPFAMGFDVRAGNAPTSAYSSTQIVTLSGFFESQEAWCSALQDAIAANATLAALGTWSVRPTDDGKWDLFYATNGTPIWVTVQGGSDVDGGFTGGLLSSVVYLGAEVVTRAASVEADTEYRCEWSRTGATGSGVHSGVAEDQLRRVPRANYDHGIYGSTGASTYPRRRYYLDFAASLGSWGSVKITLPVPDGSTDAPAVIDATVGVYSASGYIEITDTAIDVPPFGAAGSYGPTFELATIYGPVGTLGRGCTFAEFMQAIVDAAPLTANIGAPFVLDDDIDLATWSTEVAAASSGISGLSARVYSFSKPKKLIDVVREECKLHGLYLLLNSDGKITVKRLPASGSATPGITIDYTVHSPTDDFGKMRLSPDGLISSVEISGGYVAADDKWTTSDTFNALGTQAVTKSKGQALTIKPYARPFASSGGSDIPAADMAALVGRVLNTFGQQYYFVDVPVTLIAYDARIGDEAYVTIKQLPFAGSRGMHVSGGGLSNQRAHVVGRSWRFGDATGVLTLMVQARRTAGYAPTLRPFSATGAGTSWSFHCNDDFYGPRRASTDYPADAEFFAAGYRVIVWEVDSDSPASYPGTVSSVVGDIVSITFDAPFPGLGSGTWDISFSRSTDGITAAQKAYVFMADPTGRIAYVDGTSDPTRQLA